MTNPVARQVTLNRQQDGESVPGRDEVLVYCPGCRCAHHFTIKVYEGYPPRPSGQPEPVWGWDGNLERPTFNPSLLCYSTVHLCRDEHAPVRCEDPDNCGERGHLIMGPDNWRDLDSGQWILGHDEHTRDPAWGKCHSFLRNGVWEFLSDSEHDLAGQHVEMVPLPDHLMTASHG